MRIVTLVLGIGLLVSGLLFAGQGLGLIMWPEESPMLAQRQWALNGTILALVGAFLLWARWRRRG